MATVRPLTFGQLLRRHRMAAALTQAALATRTGMSARHISDLERGVRSAPYNDAIALLAQALQLSPQERRAFEAAAHRRPAPPSGDTTSLPPPFIGRTRELIALGRHLSGEGPPALLLVGAPGIGKTRLLRETAVRAREQGVVVLEGGCQQRHGQPPYAPLLDAIVGYIRQASPARRRVALRGCGWLITLIPPLAEMAEFAVPQWTLPPAHERRLLFAAVTRFLANVAGPLGALLLLDDLQWAGADALDLLATIARSADTLRLRLVAAYRDTEVAPGDPLAALLADLAREQIATPLALGPLAPREAAQLLESLLEGAAPLDAAQSEWLLQRTGGVPFFLVSCAQALRAGALARTPAARNTPVAGEPGMSWDIAQQIRQRVAALSPAARELLDVAAVIGRQAPRGVLLAAATRLGRSKREAARALEAACQAGLLALEGTQEYHFTHDLIMEVLGAGISPARRTLLHQTVAQAWERQTDAPPLDALAHHYERAGATEQAITYLERAGDRARALCAPAAAERYYRALLDLLETQDRATAAARVREKLADALTAQARYDQAIAALEEAIATFRAANDLQGEARATAQLAQVYASRGTPEDGLARLQPLLDAPARGDLAARELAALYVAQACLLDRSGRHAAQLVAAEHAVSVARAIHDESLLAAAEGMRGRALVALGRTAAALPALQAASHLAERLGDLEMFRDALHHLSWVYATRGAYDDARQCAERARELAEQIGERAAVACAFSHRGLAAFLSGAWDQARVDLDRAVTLAREAGPSSATAAVLSRWGVLGLAEGRWEEAARALEEAATLARRAADPRTLWAAQGALAERDLLQGRPQAARDRLEPLLTSSTQDDQAETGSVFLLPLMAWACLDTGAMDQAAPLLTLSIDRARDGQNQLALLDALRVLGALATRQGHWDEAEAALAEALALSRALTCPYAEAKVLYAAGLLDSAQEQMDQARSHLEAALAICARLGERLYATQAARALAAIEQ
jgi:predicted ATPase/DNA-binding XRE family transcriptional regulator